MDQSKATKSYDFGKSDFLIEFAVRSADYEPGFRLSKPTLDDLLIRERQINDLNFSEENANAVLFNKIAVKVKGYRLPGEHEAAMVDYRDATKELLAIIPTSSKSRAIVAIYSAKVRVTNETIQLIIGDSDQYVIEFKIRRPDYNDARKFISRSTRLVQVKGFRKPRSKFNNNLRDSIQFFDAHIESINGGVVNGSTFDQASDRGAFLSEIDGVFKQLSVWKYLELS